MATTTKGYYYPAPSDTNNVPLAMQTAAAVHDARPGVAVLTTVQRDALAGAELWNGRLIVNTTTNRLERYRSTGTAGWYANSDELFPAILMGAF